MKNNISFIYSINSKKTQLNTVKLYIYFLFSSQKKQVLLLITLALLSGLIPSIDSLFLQNITDSIEAYSDKALSTVNLPTLLFKWVIIYALWWESLNILWRVYDYLYLKAMPKIKAHVTDEFYNYVQYHSHEFFQSNLAGDITNRISEASRSIEMVFAYINESIVRKLSVLIL